MTTLEVGKRPGQGIKTQVTRRGDGVTESLKTETRTPFLRQSTGKDHLRRMLLHCFFEVCTEGFSFPSFFNWGFDVLGSF